MIGTVTAYQRRETIFSAGDEARRLPKLLAGAVLVYALLPDGRRQVLYLAGPGDILHFETGGEIDHYAEALGPCQVIWYEADALLADRDACDFLMEQMRDRLAFERRHITLLCRKTAIDRLMEFVRYCAECLGDSEADFPLPLTRQQIADFTGLTLETVSRTFAQWERDDTLTRTGRQRYCLKGAIAA